MDEQLFQIGVKALIKNSEGKILLLKNRADPSPAKKWEEYWDIAGGRIKAEDNLIDTLIREIEEELGLTEVKVGKVFGAGISNIKITVGAEKVPLFLIVYECKIPKDAQIVLSKEHSAYKWVDKKTARELLSDKFPGEFVKLLE